MKKSLLFIILLSLSKLLLAQNVKQQIDYQYFRDDKSYYAFELYKELNAESTDLIKLNFSSNSIFKKVDKIYITSNLTDIKIKFRQREEKIDSDNPEMKFYPLVLSLKELKSKDISCDAVITFKLDNGYSLSLPFSMCNISEQLARTKS